MPSVDHYLALLADQPRVAAFAQAIRRAVRRGDVVADLGSGLGSTAVVAALAGARKVYAVEQDGVGRLGAEVARASGVADRIELLVGRSTELEVPERVDVCIFDDFRVLEPGGRASETIDDARARWLGDGGRIIPQRVEMWAAPVGALPRAAGLSPSPKVADYGIDVASLRRLALSTPWPVWMSSDASVLAAPRRLSRDLDSDRLDASGAYTARRSGRVVGLATWLVLRLTARTTLDAGPSAPRTAYPQGFFPLPEPIRVNEGGRVGFRLRYSSHAGAGEPHRLWSWELSVGETRSGGSTFATMPLPTAGEVLGDS